jgi:hypothetical protein
MTAPAALPPYPPPRLAPAAEELAPRVDVAEAAREVRRALERVRLSQRGYAAVRAQAARPAVTRARTDWGLAVLEWIEASALLAEAEDRRDPARAARQNRGALPAPGEDPARRAVAECWQAYQRARRDGRPDRVGAARDRWRDALVTWFQEQAGQRAAEDEQRPARGPAEGEAGPPAPEPAAEAGWPDSGSAPDGKPASGQAPAMGWEPASGQAPATGWEPASGPPQP